MCIRSVAFLVTCVSVGVNTMAIPKSFSPRWLSYLRSEITPTYRCFAGEEVSKGMQCLALCMLLLTEEEVTEDKESFSKERKMLRHSDEDEVDIGTEYEEEEDSDKKKKKKKRGSSFKEGHRKRKRKTNVLIPAAIGLAAVIMTVIVGVVGVVAGKALAMSFLAFVTTIALSTRAIASHQRRTAVNDVISDALAEIEHQLYAESDVPVDAIVYSSRGGRNT